MLDVKVCDRCRATITLTGYRAVHKDGRELLLCKVHLRDHEPALVKQGWTIDRLVPPDPVAGPLSKVECGVCKQSACARTVTATPESVPVQLVHCGDCDRRRCNTVTIQGKCDSQPTDPADPICSKGHTLMGES